MNMLRIAIVALAGAVLVACDTVQPRPSGPQSPIPAPPIPAGGGQSGQSGGESGGQGQAGNTGSTSGQSGQSGQSGTAGGGGSMPGGQGPGQESDSGDPFGSGGGSGSRQAAGGAEDALGDSLEEFDEAFGSEQEALGRAGGGSAADEEVAAGSEGGEDVSAPGERTAGGPLPGDPRVVPGDGPGVEGCNDADVVARQLCEIATEEEDPFLRARLWEEYNEYRRIVARQ